MKKKLSITYLVVFIAPWMISCGGSVKEESTGNASVGPLTFDQRYTVDTSESLLTWKGSMVLSSEDHIGYVHVSKGELMMEKGQLVGGTIEIDMNSIEYKDKTNKNTPVNHLKSPDYFDVERFPTSTIKITKLASTNSKTIEVTGNLTIKDVTRAVTFPAVIEVKDGVLQASGRLIIDRTDWGIRYRSGKFYDKVADQIVSDDIEFNVTIVARSNNNKE